MRGFGDDWKVTRSLTLNLGVRCDYFQPPTERDGLFDGSFLDRRENLLLFGSPGAGKSHLSKRVSRMG